MDCIVSFASPPNAPAEGATPSPRPRGTEAGARPHTPHLKALLCTLREQAWTPLTSDFEAAAGLSLSTPAEQVRAQWLGLNVNDGQQPWAAIELAQAGEDPGSQAWAYFHPCHWHIAHDHVRMHDPDAIGLSDAHSRALLEVLGPFLAEDGIELRYLRPSCWLARGDALEGVACASLDRVVGRRLEAWMQTGRSGGGATRRLQQEVQMLLYTHPVSDAPGGPERPVNSFWLSGAGRLPAAWSPKAAPTLQAADGLRAPSLEADAQGWAKAWGAMDAGPMANAWSALQAGEPVRLALCGETRARVFAGQSPGWGASLRRALGLGPTPSAVWDTL